MQAIATQLFDQFQQVLAYLEVKCPVTRNSNGTGTVASACIMTAIQARPYLGFILKSAELTLILGMSALAPELPTSLQAVVEGLDKYDLWALVKALKLECPIRVDKTTIVSCLSSLITRDPVLSKILRTQELVDTIIQEYRKESQYGGLQPPTTWSQFLQIFNLSCPIDQATGEIRLECYQDIVQKRPYITKIQSNPEMYQAVVDEWIARNLEAMSGKVESYRLQIDHLDSKRLAVLARELGLVCPAGSNSKQDYANCLSAAIYSDPSIVIPLISQTVVDLLAPETLVPETKLAEARMVQVLDLKCEPGVNPGMCIYLNLPELPWLQDLMADAQLQALLWQDRNKPTTTIPVLDRKSTAQLRIVLDWLYERKHKLDADLYLTLQYNMSASTMAARIGSNLNLIQRIVATNDRTLEAPFNQMSSNYDDEHQTPNTIEICRMLSLPCTLVNDDRRAFGECLRKLIEEKPYVGVVPARPVSKWVFNIFNRRVRAMEQGRKLPLQIYNLNKSQLNLLLTLLGRGREMLQRGLRSDTATTNQASYLRYMEDTWMAPDTTVLMDRKIVAAILASRSEPMIDDAYDIRYRQQFEILRDWLEIKAENPTEFESKIREVPYAAQIVQDLKNLIVARHQLAVLDRGITGTLPRAPDLLDLSSYNMFQLLTLASWLDLKIDQPTNIKQLTEMINYVYRTNPTLKATLSIPTAIDEIIYLQTPRMPISTTNSDLATVFQILGIDPKICATSEPVSGQCQILYPYISPLIAGANLQRRIIEINHDRFQTLLRGELPKLNSQLSQLSIEDQKRIGKILVSSRPTAPSLLDPTWELQPDLAFIISDLELMRLILNSIPEAKQSITPARVEAMKYEEEDWQLREQWARNPGALLQYNLERVNSSGLRRIIRAYNLKCPAFDISGPMITCITSEAKARGLTEQLSSKYAVETAEAIIRGHFKYLYILFRDPTALTTISQILPIPNPVGDLKTPSLRSRIEDLPFRPNKIAMGLGLRCPDDGVIDCLLDHAQSSPALTSILSNPSMMLELSSASEQKARLFGYPLTNDLVPGLQDYTSSELMEISRAIGIGTGVFETYLERITRLAREIKRDPSLEIKLQAEIKQRPPALLDDSKSSLSDFKTRYPGVSGPTTVPNEGKDSSTILSGYDSPYLKLSRPSLEAIAILRGSIPDRKELRILDYENGNWIRDLRSLNPAQILKEAYPIVELYAIVQGVNLNRRFPFLEAKISTLDLAYLTALVVIHRMKYESTPYTAQILALTSDNLLREVLITMGASSLQLTSLPRFVLEAMYDFYILEAKIPTSIKQRIVALERNPHRQLYATIHGSLLNAAFAPPEAIDGIIDHLTTLDPRTLNDTFGIVLPQGSTDVKQYFMDNILEYRKVVNRTDPVTYDAKALLSLPPDQALNWLETRKDSELLTIAFIPIRDRKTLVHDIYSLIHNPNFFYPTVRQCNNRTTASGFDTSDAAIPVIAFGTLSSYFCYDYRDLIDSLQIGRLNLTPDQGLRLKNLLIFYPESLERNQLYSIL